MNKRAQAWGFDLMIAMAIFVAGIIFFYFYAVNMPNETENINNRLAYAGDLIANNLLSEGSPSNWDESNVITIGITSKDKINQTKLERFYNLATTNYQKSKLLFNTQYEYYITFSKNITINGNEVEGIGSLPINPKNLIRVNRISIYKDKPSTLNINIWE